MPPEKEETIAAEENPRYHTFAKRRSEEHAIREREAATILDLMQRRMDLLRPCLTDPQEWGTPWPPQFVADELASLAQSLRKFIWLQVGEG